MFQARGAKLGKHLLRVFIALFLFACEDSSEQDPAADAAIDTAQNKQESQLLKKGKIDLLFVMDNSGSMCEEQDKIAQGFSVISQFLSGGQGGARDYRLAVLSTDVYFANQEMGSFLLKPAPAAPASNCFDQDGNPYIPDTADCVELVANGDLEAVLRSGPGGNVGQDCPEGPERAQCLQADLETKFRCLITLGTTGDNFEKGLEAMRMGLSCDGPNRERFGPCCVCSDERSCEYNPSCQISEGSPEPEFLRPDASLVVVIISDEDDCSDPITNPGMSRHAICKYGAVDLDADRIPDGYQDQELCEGSDPEACYRNECGVLATDQNDRLRESAEECYQQRCQIRREQNSNCEWFRDILTPVTEYVDFLKALKPRQPEQLIVISIVGERLLTFEGDEIFFNPGSPRPECETQGRYSEPYSPVLPLEECCPQGQCLGNIQPSCSSSNGIAFTGHRYLKFASSFGASGLEGCDAVGERCISICSDDFSDELTRVQEQVILAINSHRLSPPPACVVSDRPCESDEERRNLQNYQIRLHRQCLLDHSAGGFCSQVEEPTPLPDDAWSLEFEVQPGSVLLRLRDLPPAGTEILLEYLASPETP